MTNTAAKLEIEVKFFDVPLADIREKLKLLGAKCKTPERLMRRVVFGSEANKGMTCTYGRVRDEGNTVTMSAKYSARNNEILSQREIELTINNFDDGVALLESFGLAATNRQENKRETWQVENGTLIELETWPQLPTYIEIEGPSVEAIQKVASDLGLDWGKHITDTTGKLYALHLSLTPEEAEEKIRNLRF